MDHSSVGVSNYNTNFSSLLSFAGTADQYSTSPIFTDVIETSTLMNSNFSTPNPVKGAKTQLMLYDYLIPALGALIIILNTAVVISSGLIIRSGVQPKTTYLFLGNIAMADLITGIAVVFGQAYPKELRGEITCYIQLGMILSSTLASVWSVGLIAVDRFLYIAHGLKYQQWLYPGRARLLIVGTWFLGIIVGFLPAFGWSTDTQNGKVCWFIRLPQGLILLVVILGIVPVVLVLSLYSVILFYALRTVTQLRKADEGGNTDTSSQNCKSSGSNVKNMRVFRGGRSTDQAPKSKPKKSKAIKVVFFTTTSFVITWVPYFIACLIYIASKDESFRKSLSYVIAAPLAILGFVNSLINPVIYAWWHNGFRTFIKKQTNKLHRYISDRSSTTRSHSTQTTSARSSNKSSSNTNSKPSNVSFSTEPSKDETHL